MEPVDYEYLAPVHLPEPPLKGICSRIWDVVSSIFEFLYYFFIELPRSLFVLSPLKKRDIRSLEETYQSPYRPFLDRRAAIEEAKEGEEHKDVAREYADAFNEFQLFLCDFSANICRQVFLNFFALIEREVPHLQEAKDFLAKNLVTLVKELTEKVVRGKLRKNIDNSDLTALFDQVIGLVTSHVKKVMAYQKEGKFSWRDEQKQPTSSRYSQRNLWLKVIGGEGNHQLDKVAENICKLIFGEGETRALFFEERFQTVWDEVKHPLKGPFENLLGLICPGREVEGIVREQAQKQIERYLLYPFIDPAAFCSFFVSAIFPLIFNEMLQSFTSQVFQRYALDFASSILAVIMTENRQSEAYSRHYNKLLSAIWKKVEENTPHLAAMLGGSDRAFATIDKKKFLERFGKTLHPYIEALRAVFPEEYRGQPVKSCAWIEAALREFFDLDSGDKERYAALLEQKYSGVGAVIYDLIQDKNFGNFGSELLKFKCAKAHLERVVTKEITVALSRVKDDRYRLGRSIWTAARQTFCQNRVAELLSPPKGSGTEEKMSSTHDVQLRTFNEEEAKNLKRIAALFYHIIIIEGGLQKCVGNFLMEDSLLILSLLQRILHGLFREREVNARLTLPLLERIFEFLVRGDEASPERQANERLDLAGDLEQK